MAGKNRLRVKSLNTVGFVDKGDDPKAEIMFFKRGQVTKGIKEEGGKFCVYDESGKKMGEHETREQAEAQMRAMEGHKGMDKGLVARVLKALGLQGNEVDKLLAEGAEAAANGQEKAAPTPTEEAKMDVTKLPAEAQAEFKKLSDKVTELEAKLNPPAPAPLPADVQKRIDETEKRAKDLEDQVQKMQDQRENETFIAKAKGLGLPADDFGPILRKVSKALTADELAKLETTIKALQAQAKEAGLYKEIGRGGTGAATETEGKVNELVKDLRKSNPTWSVERARGEVMKSYPELRRSLEDERMARTLQTGKED